MMGVNNPWFGKHFSEEQRQKLSEAHKGQKPSPEAIKKLVLSRIGRPLSEDTRRTISERRQKRLEELGYLNSPETREKIKLASLGRHHTPEARKRISEGLVGIHRSIETKKKISNARLKQVLPNKDTSIEKLLQRALEKEGILFVTHYSIMGQPDISLPELKVAVFCDGCYWHGCDVCDIRGKITAKKESDRRVSTKLESEGWKVLRFWEHELTDDLEGCVNRIKEVLN